MNVLILPNPKKEECSSIIDKVIDIIFSVEDNKIFALAKDKNIIKNSNIIFTDNISDCNIDFALTIGGDGTIIRAANLLLKYEIPILGINLGTLGFLANIEKNELELLKKVLKGEYTIDERMTLSVTINHQKSNITYNAINDVVICKNAFSGIIDLSVECGDIETARYRGDGIIISTPSGSTAYAMSAGGPIIHPSVKSISITPICAHSILSRTIVLPEYETIKVITNANLRKKVFVVADGMISEEICENDIVEIKKNEKNIKFICLKEKSFYSAINNKLMER